MRLMAVAVAAALAVGAASAADAAQSKKRYVQRPAGHTVFVSRDESGRTRTKIIVQKRSYLDGGTEVMPGDIPNAGNFTLLPTQRPSNALGANVITNPPGPIPDPWFLPGRDNPWPWFAY